MNRDKSKNSNSVKTLQICGKFREWGKISYKKEKKMVNTEQKRAGKRPRRIKK